MKNRFWCRLLILGLIVPSVLLFSSCNRPEKSTDGSSGDVSPSASDAFEEMKTVDISAFSDLAKMQTEGALTFTFSEKEISVSAEGDAYEISGTALKIKRSGTYRLTGACADGSVTVAKETSGVFLILDGLSLASSVGPALTCNKVLH